MAIITRAVAMLVDDSGVATIEVDYDDGAMRLTAVRVVNNASVPVEAIVVKQSNGRVYSQTFPANQTTFIPIPATPPASRVGITLDAQGRINGVEYFIRWAP